MISFDDGGLTISITTQRFEGVGRRIVENLNTISALTKVVHKWTREAQAQAVLNVSGGRVTYRGGSFVINRQTAKLARSIQSSFPTALSGAVVADAEYAAAIEKGVDHPVDLKPSLMGKTVFIPIDRDKAKPGTKLSALPQYGSDGERSGTRYGIFRKVGPNSKGWIIPPRKARPFMAAAGEKIAPGFADDAAKALAEAIGDL